MLRYLLLKIIFALIFKSSIFLKSSCTTFCDFYFILFAILIMYLFNLKIFVCSNSFFKFFKSCIAPCNAVNSGCLSKGLRLSVRGLFTYTSTCWQHNELEIFYNESAFASFIIQISRSLCRQRVGVYVNKPLTSSH